mmetsp:Transcript_177737/g.563987  ORF Transcript_177737/g.563987 Transcript_177737/m.563987 type:complete len:107 (+) Transcript_177737:204-524(+)
MDLHLCWIWAAGPPQADVAAFLGTPASLWARVSCFISLCASRISMKAWYPTKNSITNSDNDIAPFVKSQPMTPHEFWSVTHVQTTPDVTCFIKDIVIRQESDARNQ